MGAGYLQIERILLMRDSNAEDGNGTHSNVVSRVATGFWIALAALSTLLVLGALYLWAWSTTDAPRTTGTDQPSFDMSHASIDVAAIRSGGPPKDGIPALSDPEFLDADETFFLRGEDRVIGLSAGGQSRAYPLKILDLHEVVNDQIAELPVAVTYCPLCDSSAVFDRRTQIGVREFGVSGLLYNSNVLLYDRNGKPESLWSQVMAQGVTGPASGVALEAVPFEVTTWSDWVARHPKTKVLSTATGYDRKYDGTAYAHYSSSPELMFPASPRSDKLATKARVLGVWSGEHARAYSATMFSDGQTLIEDTLDGKRIVIELNSESQSLRVVESDDGLQWMYSFWFAWYAMHPNTSGGQE